MPGTRLPLQRDFYQIDQLADSIDRFKKTLLKYTDDEKRIDAIHRDLKDIANLIDQKMQALPRGHEYQGTFYIRKPYTVPITSTKITGRAYMREDLVSWRITTDDTSVNAYGNYREIFKDPELTQVIAREEGKPVFDKAP